MVAFMEMVEPETVAEMRDEGAFICAARLAASEAEELPEPE
jgi:hypothetical protein